MNKIVLSALAALTLGTVAATAGDIKLYTDANGQVFTTAGEGRTELTKKAPTLASHASKLKFSGLTYLGYTYTDYKDGETSVSGTDFQNDTSEFEIRRGYIQTKAYLLEDPKSYFRITLDLHNDGGSMVARAKYAYLYLNDVFANTGLEVGLAHRPWHDYEEHNSWYFRDISKVLVEAKNGAHLSNSADYGVMAKTRTKYLDADYGIFQGEGYHGDQNGMGVSFEWRATAHLLGVSGKDKQDKKTYWDASFFGQYNMEHIATSATNNDDLIFGGLHTVYNQPSFLVAAQYIQSQDTADNSGYVSEGSGNGYSANGEFRLGGEKEYRILGRYDSWTPEVVSSATAYEQRAYIAGLAWDQNKNVQWVANATITDNEKGSTREEYNGVAYMLTAQVEF